MTAASLAPSFRTRSVAFRLAEIARRAETLAERLARARAAGADSTDAPSSSDASPADALAGWARAFSRGDLPSLARRLAWDGLDLSIAARAVAPPAGEARATIEPLPPWLEIGRRRFGIGADLRGPSGDRLDRAAIAFAELWEPLVEAALGELRDRLEEGAGATILPLFAALAPALGEDLAAIAARAAHERYARFRIEDFASGAYRRYVDFELASGLLDFGVEFPVALRQLARRAEEWIADLAALAGALAADREALAERFAAGLELGPVVAIERLRSDRHEGGRALHRIRFGAGVDLAFKPRSLAAEAAWERLLGRLAALGVGDLPSAARALDLGDHGWMEWVPAGELADRAAAAGWFERAGALVALAELLGADDLHAENLVATARGPVLIDAEMLAQPDRATPGADPRFAGGLLRRGGAGDRAARWAGLHPVGARFLADRALAWRGVGGDDIEPMEDAAHALPLSNAARLAGGELAPETFAAPLLAGHRRTWEALLARRADLLAGDGPLAELAGLSARILLRPSQEYATAIDRLTSPRCQRHGWTGGILLEAMARPFAAAVETPRAWPLVRAERRSLEALALPRFEIGYDRETIEIDGRDVAGLVRRSARDAVAGRLAALSEETIRRRQEAIAEALTPDDGRRIGLAPPGEGDVVARALALADRLAAFERARVFEAASGRAPGAAAPPRSFERRLHELALYDGRLGRALVLALADRVDGGARFDGVAGPLEAALDAFADEVEAARRSHPSGPALAWGGLEGIGALVWGLVALSGLRDSGSAARLARARRFASWLCDSERAAAEVHDLHDLHGGTAGALLALLALAEATGEGRFRLRAAELGDRLLAAAVAAPGDGIAWPAAADELPLTGFAHGTTGIARALDALAVATGEARFAAAVERTLAFERTRFDPVSGDWPVVRSGLAGEPERRIAMTAWCHGGAGIALGRSLLATRKTPARDAAARAEIDAELDAALRATLAAGLGDFDHLCCGAAGRLAVLGSVGRRFAGSDAIARAALAPEATAASAAGLTTLLARAPRLPRAAARRPEVEAGLFRGVAGIVWAALSASLVEDAAALDPTALELPSEARERAMAARTGSAPAGRPRSGR